MSTINFLSLSIVFLAGLTHYSANILSIFLGSLGHSLSPKYHGLMSNPSISPKTSDVVSKHDGTKCFQPQNCRLHRLRYCCYFEPTIFPGVVEKPIASCLFGQIANLLPAANP